MGRTAHTRLLLIALMLVVRVAACADEAAPAASGAPGSRPADVPIATAPAVDAAAVQSADAEKTQLASRESRDDIRRLIQDFAADEYQARENAVASVIAHDQAAVPELEAVLEKSADPEVLVRARKAVIAIREAAIRGSFTQTDAKVTDAQGNIRDGDTKDGYLVIGDGKVTWYQHYGGTMTAQTYSYDVSKRLQLSDQLDVPLTYESIETQIGYSPESHDPKLQFRKTATGELKISFLGTDGMGQQMKADFVVGKKK